MVRLIREISKDIYDRAIQNKNYIVKEDKEKVWDISELCGYGVYNHQVFERDGKHFVSFLRGESCD